MTTLTQFGLDYTQEAQARVAWDARALRGQWEITLIAGQAEYDLPDQVARLDAVLSGSVSIGGVTAAVALGLISAGDTSMERAHYVVGRRIGFLPTPAVAETITLTGLARPAELNSGDELEVSGELEDLVETLVLAAALDDDRQDELAQVHVAVYQRDIVRLRQDGSAFAYPHRMRVGGARRQT